jgi:hypothetical protein
LRFASFSEVTGPFAYRNDFVFAMKVLNWNRYRMSGRASRSLSMWISYRTLGSKRQKLGPPAGAVTR